MEILFDIFIGLFLFGVLAVGLLTAWQEFNLNKERHDKEIEKLETEIIFIKEQISNNKIITSKKIERIEKAILRESRG